MGEILSERFTNLCAYGLSLAGVVTNFGDWKANILFVGAAFLLVLQITWHIIKIYDARKNRNKNNN